MKAKERERERKESYIINVATTLSNFGASKRYVFIIARILEKIKK